MERCVWCGGQIDPENLFREGELASHRSCEIEARAKYAALLTEPGQAEANEP